jgi:hypothetical protein
MHIGHRAAFSARSSARRGSRVDAAPFPPARVRRVRRGVLRARLSRRRARASRRHRRPSRVAGDASDVRPSRVARRAVASSSANESRARRARATPRCGFAQVIANRVEIEIKPKINDGS